MSEHFVTLFDAGFLPYALALHASLRRHRPDAVLWAVCMDEAAEAALARLALPAMHAIPRREVEAVDARLPATAAGRSRAEYCWTMTSFTFDAVFARAPDAARVTYVDVDVAFFADPAGLLGELDASGREVLITEHGFDDRYAHLAAASGRFCVQFLSMGRGPGATRVRRWWQERCLEWCFDRYEDGRFGDQKYLDRWPELFADAVHIVQRIETVQAPWNRQRFAASAPVLYHFQGFRHLPGGQALLFYGFAVPAGLRQPYAAYLQAHAEALAVLARLGLAPPPRPYHWAKLLKARLWLAPQGRAAFARLPPCAAC